MRNFVVLFVTIICSYSISFCQGFLVNESNNIQLVNPSYYAFNYESRAGVLYNTINYDGVRNIDSKYGFSSYSLENLNFSIGLDLLSHSVKEFGYFENQLNLTYVYKLNLGRNLYVLPSIYIGVFNRKIDASNYVFEDQLVLSQGIIFSDTNDPLAGVAQSNNSFDAGISALLHNETFMFGLSAKHINGAAIAFNSENDEKRDISISVQGAYEFEIDPYDRLSLPKHSYLFLYTSFTNEGEIMRFYASEELQLNGFKFGLHQKLTQIADFSLSNIGVNTGIEAGNIDFNAAYSFPIRNSVRNSPSIFELSMQFNFEPWFSRNRQDYKRLRTFNY
jgi:hypothetical protein